MTLLKYCTQYASKFEKLSSGRRTGKGQFSFQPQRGAKECSNYCTIAFISHASKVMLKIPQVRLQQYVNREQKMKIMASGPITSRQIDGETMETVTDFIFLGSKITADIDGSHKIKRCLLLGRKSMTNPDSILKNRDITLPTDSI